MDEFDQAFLYQLIISQLQKDGFTSAAATVSSATLTPERKDLAANRLETLVRLGLMVEREKGVNASILTANASSIDVLAAIRDIKGIDFDSDPPKDKRQTMKSNFQTKFVAIHKNSCRCATFSPDGKYVATGSTDTSIKLLEVAKMANYNQARPDSDDGGQSHRPVAKTFYDHTQSITDLAFHPNQTFLASSSRDNTIRVYDFMASAKKTKYLIQDSHEVRSIVYHPSGEYILAGTEHPTMRLYDVKEERGFLASRQTNTHLGPINQVRYSPDGKIFASCSKDGTVKFWDGVTNSCYQTLSNAHDGMEVCSVQFSRNMKYLLTGGKDNVVRLWDLTTYRPLFHIQVGGAGNQRRMRLQTRFSYNEDYILTSEESSPNVVAFDTRTQELTQRLSGHNQVVRWIAASPTDPYIMTCSDDNRARFWVE